MYSARQSYIDHHYGTGANAGVAALLGYNGAKSRLRAKVFFFFFCRVQNV